MPWFLLAMQAAGMVIDWYGNKQQIEFGRMGAKIEQAGIESNIAMTRAQSEDQSLQAMKNLRQTLGSQAAIMAARGTRSNAGSALSIWNESISNTNADERARKLNLSANEAQLKAGIVMSKLHQWQSESQLNQALRKRFFDSLPVSSFGGTSGGGAAAFAGSKASGSFGMTSV
jgi:hypothetical protein